MTSGARFGLGNALFHCMLWRNVLFQGVFFRSGPFQGMGLGDVLFNGMLLAAVLLGAHACVSEYVDRKRREERIRAAQSFEIGDGVTLLRGVQAYFGEDGFWCARDDGTVIILAGTGEPWACLVLDLETGRIRVVDYNWESFPENEEAHQALIGLMVQAAKDQNKVPGT